MKLVIINIVKGFLAIIAVLNLIFLFGFGYEIPGFNKKEENMETALYGNTIIEEDSSTALSAEESADSSADNAVELSSSIIVFPYNAVSIFSSFLLNPGISYPNPNKNMRFSTAIMAKKPFTIFIITNFILLTYYRLTNRLQFW